MPHRFYVDGTAGVAYIGDSTLDPSNVVTNPLPYLTSLSFHSDLNYLIITETLEDSVTFAKLDPDTYTYDDGCC